MFRLRLQIKEKCRQNCAFDWKYSRSQVRSIPKRFLSSTFEKGSGESFYRGSLSSRWSISEGKIHAFKMGQQGSKGRPSLRTDFVRDSTKMRLGSFKRGRKCLRSSPFSNFHFLIKFLLLRLKDLASRLNCLFV